MERQLFDLPLFLEELGRAKKKITLFVLVVSFIALVVVTFVPKEYTAEAIILPPYQTNIGVGGLLAGLAGFIGGSAGGEFVLPFMVSPSDLYASIIKTPAVMDTVIIEYGLMKDYKKRSLYYARLAFKKKLKVKQTKEGMINVSFSHREPQKAALVVNGILNRLDNINKNLRIYSARNFRIYVQERLNECAESLEVAKGELARFQKEKNLPAIEAQTGYAISNVAGISAEILKTQYELNFLRNFMTEKSERIRTLQTRLEELQKTLSALESQGILTTIPVGQIPELYFAYLDYLKKYETLQTLHTYLTQQYEQAKLEEAKDVPVIQVLYWATPNPHNFKPKRGVVTAIVFVSSLLLAFIGMIVKTVYMRYIEINPSSAQRLNTAMSELLRGRKKK